MKWAGHVALMEENRCVYGVLVGKSEERRPIGRPRLREDDNIKMDIQDWDKRAWNGSIWLRIGRGGWHL
jgi:hypothetical protein